MTRIFYDTEFLEDGKTIELISIGMVADTGDEQDYYYAVNLEMPEKRIWKHEWLMANVVPGLPQTGNPRSKWLYNYGSIYATSKKNIRDEVSDFIARFPDPELWAWYGAYDHVCLAQLFGSMIGLPDHIPMYTNDLMQEWSRLGRPRLPKQSSGIHNALEDAKHNRKRAEYLDVLARERDCRG